MKLFYVLLIFYYDNTITMPNFVENEFFFDFF